MDRLFVSGVDPQVRIPVRRGGWGPLLLQLPAPVPAPAPDPLLVDHGVPLISKIDIGHPRGKNSDRTCDRRWMEDNLFPNG